MICTLSNASETQGHFIYCFLLGHGTEMVDLKLRYNSHGVVFVMVNFVC